MTFTHKLMVTGNFDNLTRIAEFIEEISAQAGLSDKASYAVQMAVDEACSNIIEHAYGGEGKGDIELDCQLQTEGLQITIYDYGTPFEPEAIPQLDIEAPLSERSQRGMGLFFIYKLMDRVEYKFNTPQGNQLILFKRREQTS